MIPDEYAPVLVMMERIDTTIDENWWDEEILGALCNVAQFIVAVMWAMGYDIDEGNYAGPLFDMRQRNVI